MAEFWGKLSGFLIIISVLPYAWRILQGKIRPNITGWGMWGVIGLAILLTYDASGATNNVWPAVFGFTNPTIVTILAIVKRCEIPKFSRMDWACVFCGLSSLGLWLWFKDVPNLAQYGLYTALVADACAAIPVLHLAWTNPREDRPFAWVLFMIAYGLNFFAITEHTLSNYVLPIYMLVGCGTITLPLVLYRLRKKLPLREWI